MSDLDNQTIGKQWRSPFIPFVLMASTLLVFVSFQTTQLAKQASYLSTTKANQEAALNESKKIRKQLDSIASSTAQLANKGNVNAMKIIEDLKKKGITINPGQQ